MALFEVVGNHRVAGVEPGDVVELDDENLIAVLTGGGHIAPAVSGGQTETDGPDGGLVESE